jgi:hypothetical protein
MKGESNNPQVAHWTDDLDQREEFLTEVSSRIKSQSKSMAYRYRVKDDWEDIESEIRVKLLQQMDKKNPDGPFAKAFAKDSPKEAADFLLENGNFQIHEQAKSIVRKEAKKRLRQGEILEANEWSRQAKILADVRQRDLSPEIGARLFEIAQSLPGFTSVIPDFTPRDNDIVRKELLRQVGIDDLPAPIFDRVAQAAGVSSSEQRAYNEYHEEHGKNSESDRQAWSRARAKVKKAYTKASLLTSLFVLVFVFALSLALGKDTHQARSDHQGDFANQGSFDHQPDLARQGNLINQNDSDHQEV